MVDIGAAGRRRPHCDGPRRNEALYAMYISVGIDKLFQWHNSANRSTTLGKAMSGTVDNDTNFWHTVNCVWPGLTGTFHDLKASPAVLHVCLWPWER